MRTFCASRVTVVRFDRNVNIALFSAPQNYSFSIKKTSVSVLWSVWFFSWDVNTAGEAISIQTAFATLQAPSGFPLSSMGLPPRWPRLCSRCLSCACLALLAMYRTLLWLREEDLRRSPRLSPSSSDSVGSRLIGEVISFSCWKAVSFFSCSVNSSWDLTEDLRPDERRCSRIDRVTKLLLMLRYLLSKVHTISSEVRSPRLLDFSWLFPTISCALDLLEDCLRLSMYSLLQVCLLGMDENASWGLLARGRGHNSSAGSCPDLRLGLDLLLLTIGISLLDVVADRGRIPFLMARGSKFSWWMPRSGRLLRARLGRERSITVSLEDMLEEEDMLSRWLLQSSLLQIRSLTVASKYTSAAGDRLLGIFIKAEESDVFSPSLFDFLANTQELVWERETGRACAAWAFWKVSGGNIVCVLLITLFCCSRTAAAPRFWPLGSVVLFMSLNTRPRWSFCFWQSATGWPAVLPAATASQAFWGRTASPHWSPALLHACVQPFSSLRHPARLVLSSSWATKLVSAALVTTCTWSSTARFVLCSLVSRDSWGWLDVLLTSDRDSVEWSDTDPSESL